MGPQESALLRRFCTGADAEAFAELVQRYASLVYSTCWRVLKDETDAADATQETFFELTRHASHISGSLAGWLHKVATQKSIDLLRRCASRRRREEVYARTQPVEARSWQDLSSHVDLALDELDEATKSLLLERFVLGKSAAQIARERGGSKATISRRINAGLMQLRGILRRKGLLVAAGAVATVLTESASQAVSATALHGLGKMAMVGTTQAATVGARAGLAEVLVGALVVGVLSMGVYMHLGRPARPLAPPSIQISPVSGVGGTSAPGPDRTMAAAASRENTRATAPDAKGAAAEEKSGPDPLGTPAENPPSTGAATRQSTPQARPPAPEQPPTPARMLRFAGEASIGVVYLQDEDLIVPEIVKGFDPGCAHAEMEEFCRAQGEIHIPAGKRVTLCLQGPGVTPERYLAAIESLGPDDLYGLRFFSPQPIHLDDSLIAPLAKLTGLRTLDLGGVGIRPKVLSLLAGLPHVEQLTAPAGLTDAAMAEIARMPSLRILHVSRDQLTDEGLRSLGKLTSLEGLDLYGNPGITDEGLSALRSLHSLRHLRLGAASRLTDRAMTHLAALPSLKTLRLDARPITDEGLRHLSASRSLERLDLHGQERITGRGVARLGNLRQLKALDISSAAFTEADLAAIAAMANLEHLVLPRRTFTDAGVSRLAALKHLKYLWVNCSQDSPLTDAALAAISRMRELEELHIAGAGFTNQGIALLRDLDRLSALHLVFWPGLDNETLRLLAELPALRELSWGCSDHVTLSGLSVLNHLVGLESLSAADVRQDRRGLDLSGLKNLKSLKIIMRQQARTVRNEFVTVGEMFYDGDLACLSELAGLETLSLHGRGIGDKDLAHLVSLTKIKRLDIGGGTDLTDEGLKHLSNMQRLNGLHIHQSRISGRGLDSLHPFQTLQTLHISSTAPIDPEAVTRLQAALPDLQSISITRPGLAGLRSRGQVFSARQSYWWPAESAQR